MTAIVAFAIVYFWNPVAQITLPSATDYPDSPSRIDRDG